MTKASIKAAYEVAKLVDSNMLAPGVAANQLHADHGLNVNSARDLIMVYRYLMRGESFKRSLSAPDMDYFLSRIFADGGPVSLRTAIHALWLHLRYYEDKRQLTMHKLRSVAALHLANAAIPIPMEEHDANFQKAVLQSLSDSSAQRRTRLSFANKVPVRTPVFLFAFVRNPDVVAEVLLRSRGVCERCKRKAPFLKRKDKSPYLEVHHVHQLANGGEDIVENAIATCPNCHRELHYGAT